MPGRMPGRRRGASAQALQKRLAYRTMSNRTAAPTAIPACCGRLFAAHDKSS
jgi:hypothetical protein